MIPVRIQMILEAFRVFLGSVLFLPRSFVFLRMLVRQDRDTAFAVRHAAVAFKTVALVIFGGVGHLPVQVRDRLAVAADAVFLDNLAG